MLLRPSIIRLAAGRVRFFSTDWFGKYSQLIDYYGNHGVFIELTRCRNDLSIAISDRQLLHEGNNLRLLFDNFSLPVNSAAAAAMSVLDCPISSDRDGVLGWGVTLVSAATSILLENKADSPGSFRGETVAAARHEERFACSGFLQIPPFPGARARSLGESPGGTAEPEAVAAALRKCRVGGAYWGPQPVLPDRYVLALSVEAAVASKGREAAATVISWSREGVPGADISGECDPWHMLSGASALVCEMDDDLRLVAALLGVPCYHFDRDNRTIDAADVDVRAVLANTVCNRSYQDPFTGEVMDAVAAVELCGFWRRLIDSNRGISGGLGFAFWKQRHVAPLLWGGSAPFAFMRRAEDAKPGSSIAVWRAKASEAALAELGDRAGTLVEVEDGFLRSRGLGADCIPPLSITVDRLGCHFDPTQPSELELLIENGQIDKPTLERASRLRQLIVEAGIGKYEQGTAHLERRDPNRVHILVPGQVEDDRAVLTGGCGLVSNLELLKRVRETAPEAYILYKPHPDVLAGHRKGAIAERDCLTFADEVVGDLPIAALIDLADEVHVNTSLAGFEALLRGKQVTTHGVPFYAGFGLTRDLGPVPARRTAKRSLDEIAAATLLIYPRYFDPVTGLPCPAEVVVARLRASQRRRQSFIVSARRLQGKFMRRFRSLVQ